MLFHLFDKIFLKATRGEPKKKTSQAIPDFSAFFVIIRHKMYKKIECQKICYVIRGKQLVIKCDKEEKG